MRSWNSQNYERPWFLGSIVKSFLIRDFKQSSLWTYVTECRILKTKVVVITTNSWYDKQNKKYWNNVAERGCAFKVTFRVLFLFYLNNLTATAHFSWQIFYTQQWEHSQISFHYFYQYYFQSHENSILWNSIDNAPSFYV